MKELIEKIGMFYPIQVHHSLEERLKSAGIHLSTSLFLGMATLGFLVFDLFIFGFMLWYKRIAYFLAGLLGFWGPVLGLVMFVLSFIIALLLYPTFLLSALQIMADRRRDRIIDVLPEFLALAASNMRAGMTVDQALWYASKDEFGALSQEMKRALKEVFSGESVDAALQSLANTLELRSIQRLVDLLIQAMRVGGNVAEILDRASDEARETRMLKKEIATVLTQYELFIFIAVAFGAPLLLSALSLLMEQMSSNIPTTPTTAMVGQISLKPPNLDPGNVQLIMLILLLITAFSASSVVSIIKTGKSSGFVNYFFLLAPISIAVFFIVRIAMQHVLGSIFL